MRTLKRQCEMDENWQKNHRNAKILAGIFVITAGVLFMFAQQGVDIARWLLKWEFILIAIGIVMLVKHNFKKNTAYVLIAIGGIFLLNDVYPDIIDTKIVWPVAIIYLGIVMIFRSGAFKKKEVSEMNNTKSTFESVPGEDFVQSNAFFSGITKKVVSKSFKGASVTSVFGGNEINLSQADFTGEATIDVTATFGGVNLIVPSNWKIKSDVTSIFGGIDDQRPQVMSEMVNEDKVLILKGTCIFGGIEIHSYN